MLVYLDDAEVKTSHICLRRLTRVESVANRRRG